MLTFLTAILRAVVYMLPAQLELRLVDDGTTLFDATNSRQSIVRGNDEHVSLALRQPRARMVRLEQRRRVRHGRVVNRHNKLVRYSRRSYFCHVLRLPSSCNELRPEIRILRLDHC